MKIELKQIELDSIAEELLDCYSDAGQIKKSSFIKSFDDYDVEVFYEVETEYKEVIGGDIDEILCEVDYNRISVDDIVIYTENEDAVAEYIKEYNNELPTYRQVYKVNYTAIPLEKTGTGKIKRKENR